MTSSYELEYPKRVLFGCGAIDKLSSELPKKSKVLLVTGSSAVRSGLRDKVLAALHGHSVECISGIAPEPPLEDVDRIISAGRERHFDAIAAIGGGSVIDAAKAAAAIIPAGGFTADYFSGAKSIPGKGLIFAAAPTTAGTGAEITKNSVLTDAKSKVKKSLRHSSMTPDIAIVDPELTLSCPQKLTAASGLDAFIQAVEGFSNPKANSVTMSLAAKAASKIFKSIERACENPSDLAARTEMAEGSLLSALAFSQTGLGAIHGIAHPVGSLLGVPHGVACAIVMRHVLEWNMPSCRDDYSILAEACGFKRPEDFVAGASAIATRLAVPESLSSYGLTREHFPFIIKNCRSASMSLNPRPMSDEDVAAILEKLL